MFLYYEGCYVVIIGCDMGFGYMLVKELDVRGFFVFVGCLINNGEEELKKLCLWKLRIFLLDVFDFDLIKKVFFYIKV